MIYIVIFLLAILIIFNSINYFNCAEDMVTVGLDVRRPYFNLSPETISRLGPTELSKITDRMYESLTHNQIVSFTPKQILYIYSIHPSVLPPKVEYLFGTIIKNASDDFALNNLTDTQRVYGVKNVQFKYTAPPNPYEASA
jgi:hypothetical protein